MASTFKGSSYGSNPSTSLNSGKWSVNKTGKGPRAGMKFKTERLADGRVVHRYGAGIKPVVLPAKKPLDAIGGAGAVSYQRKGGGHKPKPRKRGPGYQGPHGDSPRQDPGINQPEGASVTEQGIFKASNKKGPLKPTVPMPRYRKPKTVRA